jgi:hypothetical protein|nr:MAG TPA: hypothetical protein [Caudoviricetes sp.]
MRLKKARAVITTLSLFLYLNRQFAGQKLYGFLFLTNRNFLTQAFMKGLNIRLFILAELKNFRGIRRFCL